jgi:hypothetical protein
MPVMSGIDLLKWMRIDHRYAGTPFMMLTAQANPQSVRTALRAGVNAYMIKPFTVHSVACKFMGMPGVQLETAPAPAAPLPPDIPTNIEVLAGVLKDEYAIKVEASPPGGSVSMDTGHGRTRPTITRPCP